jgi:YYY domain-containing protein
MRKSVTPFFLLAFTLICLGIGLRFSGLDFDHGCHLHPDERFMTMVCCGIEWPENPAAYFATSTSPLNPVNRGFNFYVYGDLPLVLVKAAADLTGTGDYEHLVYTGRLLSALADSGVIILVFLIAADFFGFTIGLVAAVLYALSVLPIQLSHFYTCDPFLNLFLTASLYAAMRFSRTPTPGFALATGLTWGLALATKISALAFAPVFLACGLLAIRQHPESSPLKSWLASLALAFLTFRVLQPYAFAGPNFFNFSLADEFLASLHKLRDISQPLSGFPPSLQWAFRTPLIFALKNLVSWGTGTALAAAGLAGALWCGRRGVREKDGTILLPLLLAGGIFASILCHPVQTMRYLLPVYPVVAISAAAGLCEFRQRSRPAPTSWWPLGGVIAATLIWAVSFHAIYRQPMPRVAASEWLEKNLSATATIGVEHWDDALPCTGHNNRFRHITLDLYAPDNREKIINLVKKLDAVDYLVISSNRLYTPITRLRNRYPATSRYYEMLFGNTAGFSLVGEFFSYPGLGRWLAFPDDEAEEAFTVYDHPRVFIFARDPDFSRGHLQNELFTALARRPPDRNRAFSPVIPVTRQHLELRERLEPLYLARFILFLVLLGITGQWLSNRLFPSTAFPGRLLVGTLALFFYAGCLKLAPWSPAATDPALLLLLIIPAGIQLQQNNLSHSTATGVESGLVFWLVFLFFLLVRGHNPAIFWGERPMDFSLLNAMLRCENYPPVDPWFSGAPLRYYGWGQLFIALTGRLTRVPAAYLYNLGTALVPALAAELCYWTIKRLTGRKATAASAVFLLLFAGNLSAAILQPWQNGWQFNDFWQASRIVPDTINEFPFWSSLFGDLHAHFIGMIFSSLFIAALVLQQTTDHPARSRAGWIAALAGAALALTNPWAIPVYAFLLMALAMSVGGRAGAIFFFTVIGAGVLLALPFWSSPSESARLYKAALHLTPEQMGILFAPFLLLYLLWYREIMRPTRIRQLLFVTLAGITIYLSHRGIAAVIAVLLCTLFYLWKKKPAANGIFLSLLTATGLFTLIGCDLFMITDQMNTIFKFHFETWIVFSLAAALILDHLWSSFRRPAGGLLILLFVLMFMTSLCCLRSWWSNPKVPTTRFTFDGLRYLLRDNPDLRMAVYWLNHEYRRKQPVVCEAFGPSYGPYGRISSFTGLPTILGWEYHVFQRGHPWREIRQRQHDIEQIYRNTDPKIIHELVAEYGIKTIYFGHLEKEVYGEETGANLRKARFYEQFKFGDETAWASHPF